MDALVAVDPDHAGVKRPGELVRALQVPGPEARAQAVERVVGDGQGFGVVPERGHCDEGAEHFLAGDAVMRRCAHDRRLHEVAAWERGRRPAARQNLPAFLERDIDEGQHALMVDPGRERAHFGFGVQRIAQAN